MSSSEPPLDESAAGNWSERSANRLVVLDVVPEPREPTSPRMRLVEGVQRADRHLLFGIELDLFSSTDEAAIFILTKLRAGCGSLGVFTCNVDHLMLMRENEEFREAYARADVVTIDGAPVALLARRTGASVATRVTGADLIPALARYGEATGLRIALVGGAPGRAELAAEELGRIFPTLSAVDAYCPDFGFDIGGVEDRKLVEQIARTKPDIVVVCLGAPRQELWIDAHKNSFTGTALIGAGATIDFLSGGQRRAPIFVQRSGLEAVYRLVTNFRRLWRRYLVRDTAFFYHGTKFWFLHRAMERKRRYRDS